MPKYSVVLNADSPEELRRLAEALYIAEVTTFKKWCGETIIRHYTEMFGQYEDVKKELKKLEGQRDALRAEVNELEKKIREYRNALANLQREE